MTDVFSRKQRSNIMSKIKGYGNVATELRFAGLLREAKIKGWRRHSRTFGKPDFIFPSQRIAVFVDGCFWHGCPHHGTLPATNVAFWRTKLDRNRQRDRLVSKTLRASGWTVLRIWQHELREPKRLTRRVRRALAYGQTE